MYITCVHISMYIIYVSKHTHINFLYININIKLDIRSMPRHTVDYRIPKSECKSEKLIS